MEGQWIAAVDGYRYRSKPQYELVTTLDQFDALRDEWDALLPRSDTHAVFSSHAWLRAALICRPEHTPHIATLRIDGGLEAILPFVRTAGGIEFATFLSDYNDFIASSRLHAARAFHSMLRTLPTGTRVVMRGLREESDALAVARACTPNVRVTAETTCPLCRSRRVVLRDAIAFPAKGHRKGSGSRGDRVRHGLLTLCSGRSRKRAAFA